MKNTLIRILYKKPWTKIQNPTQLDRFTHTKNKAIYSKIESDKKIWFEYIIKYEMNFVGYLDGWGYDGGLGFFCDDFFGWA